MVNNYYDTLHITESKNIQSIINNGFNISIHDAQQKRCQWLGDGVYFWEKSEDSKKVGKSLVINKYTTQREQKRCNCSAINVLLGCCEDEVMNFVEQKDYDIFLDFWDKKVEYMKRNIPAELFDEEILDSFQKMELLFKENRGFSNNFGALLGDLVNEFCEQNEEKIEIVICQFITNPKMRNRGILGKQVKRIYQYCVKDNTKIPNVTREMVYKLI